ncbi:MAG: hypothetical protein ACJATT_003999, partial [Myxococcota bacterium]
MTVAKWVLRSALGLAAVMTTASAAKADPPTTQSNTRGSTTATERMPQEAIEDAVLGQFTDLTADATQARMEELRGDPALSGHFAAVATKLATPGTVAADLEESILPLVEGRTEEDVDVTLAAIMLDQYQSNLRAGLLLGEQQAADVAKVLVDRDAVLTTAATEHRSRGTARQASRARRLV